MTYPGGFYIQYNRDAIGRVVGIWNGAASPYTYYYVTGVAYGAPNGAISLISYSGGASESFSYTASGRLSYADIRTAGVPQGRMRWSYARASGRITRIDEVRTSTTDYRDYFATCDYSYDRWGRLASAVRRYDDSYGNWSTDWSLSYSYDRYGNMLGRQNPPINWSQTFTVDTATNRMLSYTTARAGNPSTVTCAYDAAGNSVTRGSRSVAWDGAGRLEQVWRASDGALDGSYRYDPLGRRVKKTWDYPASGGQQLAGSELYVYGAGGEVLLEYRSESGEWSAVSEVDLRAARISIGR